MARGINEFASAENGVVAFASSTGRKDSVENDAWQNGAFTKAWSRVCALGGPICSKPAPSR
jgi:hypothetical protein